MFSKIALVSLVAASLAMPAAAAIVITVENPGVTNTTAAGTFSVENFDGAAPGFVTNIADTIGAIAFTYTGIDVRAADVYGGVGGSQYAATYSGLNFSPYDQSAGTYSLTVTSTGGPINYFGAYFTAQDFNNEISFYNGGILVTTFTPALVLSSLGSFGNYLDPNDLTNFFANIYFTGGQTYDSIIFSAAGAGTGFESDNHTIGTYTPPIGGNVVVGVPEPTTWVMLLSGFALVGVASRRRSRNRTVAA